MRSIRVDNSKVNNYVEQTPSSKKNNIYVNLERVFERGSGQSQQCRRFNLTPPLRCEMQMQNHNLVLRFT